jgi:hypothetical protein
MQKHFKPNFSGKSTYTCRICDHRTRETGLGEQDVELCAACYDLCGYQNSQSDDGVEQLRPMRTEVEALIAAIEKRGQGDAGWRNEFKELLEG